MTETAKQAEWDAPKAVDAASVAFPSSLKGLLPPMADIPAEFKKHRGTEWNRLVSQWFFEGLSGKLIPKAGIDYTSAMRHLHVVMSSWEPKHEHKEAGVAFLLSRWFDRYEPA